MGRVHYLVNPAGHGGAGLAAWQEFESLWPDAINPADVTITEYAGHAGEIAASLDGDDVAVAVGGDGTVNEIMTALLDHPEPRPRLGIIPGGTGNDIARERWPRSRGTRTWGSTSCEPTGTNPTIPPHPTTGTPSSRWASGSPAAPRSGRG
jgi:hypothetical protein